MATGVDVSEWDVKRHPGVINRGWMAGFDFVIVRVANENGIPDQFASWLVNEARACGKPWGGYAWPVVGRSPEWNHGYARGLVEQWGVGPLGLAADAEHSPRGFAGPELVEAFCRGVQAAGTVAPYYCAIGELHRTPFLDTLPWWLADYTYNDGAYYPPEHRPPVPPPGRPWAVHQFTSRGWPDGGSLDVNYAATLDWAQLPTRRPEAPEMFIVQIRETNTQMLYTAWGVTPNIDETFGNELAISGVPRYNVPGNVADSIALIHLDHYRKLTGAAAGGGGGPLTVTLSGQAIPT